MSKSKKDPLEGASASSLRRTINYPPGSSNNLRMTQGEAEKLQKKSEDYDGRSSRASSKSSDSSPDRKKAKFGKPVARGSDHSFIYDKEELKNISITIRNKRAKPPLLQITNPESITPVRRPEYLGRGEDSPEYGYRSVASEDRRYEGKHPIFFKSKEGSRSRSPENRKHEFLGSSRRKGERKRPESPEYRSRKSRRDSPSRRHRRNRSTSSRHSCSSSSSSSSEERRRRKHHFYRMRSERERLHMMDKEKWRRDYELLREIERRQHRPPSPPHPHPHSHSSNGAPKPPSFLRKKEDKLPGDEEEDVEDHHEMDPAACSTMVMRPGYPVRPPRPPPPYMMRPMRSFVPAFVPPYPPRPGFYPVPHMPPVAFRPMPPRGPRPRGFFHP